MPRRLGRKASARCPATVHTVPVVDRGTTGAGSRLESRLALLSRRSVIAAGLGLCAIAVAPEVDAASHLGGPGHETGSRSARRLVDPDAVFSVRTSRPWAALTFDDGPDPRYTPAVLDVLRRFDARATFFVVGRNVMEHPDLARRIVAEGHRLANHTLEHVWLDRLAGGAVDRQLGGGRDAIRALDPEGSLIVRPPRGWTSRAVVDRTRELGMRTAYWSVCLEAALRDGPASAGAETCRRLRPGAVLLAHDGGRVTGPNPQDIDRSGTVESLPLVLERLSRKGIRGVPLQDLLRA